MAQLTINVRDDIAAEILDAFDARYSRDPADTKAQHFKKKVKEYIRDNLTAYRREQLYTQAEGSVVIEGDVE